MKKHAKLVLGLSLWLLVGTILVACGTTTVDQSTTVNQMQIDDYAETDLPTVSSFEVVQRQYLSKNGLETSVFGGVGILGEVGKLSIKQAKRSDWQTLTLNNTYDTIPVVIMNPVSFNGGHPATIRVRNVTNNSFQFRIDEWLYQNGRHKEETVSYMVAEAGSHNLGTLQLEVGSIDTDHKFAPATFNTPFQNAPVVFTQSQSYKGSHPVITRLRGITATGFETKLQEEEAQGSHVVETVGFIAFSQGTGTIQSDLPTADDDLAVAAIVDTPYEVVRTPEEVNRRWYDLSLQNTYDNPIFLAGIQTYQGPDTANLRYRNLSNNQVEIKIQEERSKDSETYHVKEVVGYVVLEAANAIVNGPVIPTNTVPTATDDAVSIDENSATNITALLLENDADLDEDTLSITSVTALSNGGVVSLANGVVSLDTNGDFKTLGFGASTTTAFDYTLSDGSETVTATVTVTVNGVNDAPVANPDTSAFTADQTATIIAVLDNDSDIDAEDTLSITGITQPSRGLVSINNSGELSFDPNGAFENLLVEETETVSFSYTISDSQELTSETTVEVTVTGSKVLLTVDAIGNGSVVLISEALEPQQVDLPFPESPDYLIDCGILPDFPESGGNIISAEDCSELFNLNPTQTVILEAYPNAEITDGGVAVAKTTLTNIEVNIFGVNVNWEGCTTVLEDGRCEVEMSESKTVTVTFANITDQVD